MKKCSRGHSALDLGRSMTGRRAYRCQICGEIWTDGSNGLKSRFSPQRRGYQFHDTGADKREDE